MDAHGPQMNAAVQAELRSLAQAGILTAQERDTISERYPITPWDMLRLVRGFTLLGAVMMGVGLLILTGPHVADFAAWLWPKLNPYVVAELGSAALTASMLMLGRWVKTAKGLERLGGALELVACFGISSFTFALGAHFSTGSGHWPALLGIDAVPLFALAYLRRNRLVLTYACVNVFFFMGAETGYISGWGVYWLGLNYPIRYVLIGAATLAFGLWHERQQLVPHFGRVYTHFGLLMLNLGMWFLSLFGYDHGERWRSQATSRFLFTMLWGLVSAASLWAGTSQRNTTLRSYGSVFLIINVYTAYFQFIIPESIGAWFLHMLLVGGSMVALAVSVERHRQRGKSIDAPPADPL